MTGRMVAPILLAGLSLAGGCGGGGFPTDRQALLHVPTDVPPSFLTDTLPGPVPAEGLCHSPLRDPRDGTLIRLYRSNLMPAEGTRLSAGYRGDYRVEGGRYGVGETEYLRVDCRTGRAIGIVPG